jgi:hypothetical protein
MMHQWATMHMLHLDVVSRKLNPLDHLTHDEPHMGIANNNRNSFACAFCLQRQLKFTPIGEDIDSDASEWMVVTQSAKFKGWKDIDPALIPILKKRSKVHDLTAPVPFVSKLVLSILP